MINPRFQNEDRALGPVAVAIGLASAALIWIAIEAFRGVIQ